MTHLEKLYCFNLEREPPMLVLLFETALFKLRANKPLSEVLFQLPPASANPARSARNARQGREVVFVGIKY